MGSCNEYQAKIYPYLDNELTGEERADLESHLNTCAVCKREMEEVSAFTQRVRAARPSIAAPESLKDAVARKLHEAQMASPGSVFPSPVKRRSHVLSWATTAAAAAILIVAGVLARSYGGNRSGMRAMEQAAITVHQGIEQKTLPLDVSSDSSSEVSSWFSKRVSFPFRMANSGIASEDRAQYKLLGGRLVTVKNQQAAMLAFSLPHQVVTMLVASDSVGKASGGSTVLSNGITFHSHQQAGLHVVSWNTHGLTYVLTSNQSMGNVQSCGSCHRQAPSDAPPSSVSAALEGVQHWLHAQPMAPTNQWASGQ